MTTSDGEGWSAEDRQESERAKGLFEEACHSCWEEQPSMAATRRRRKGGAVLNKFKELHAMGVELILTLGPPGGQRILTQISEVLPDQLLREEVLQPPRGRTVVQALLSGTEANLQSIGFDEAAM